MAMMGMTSSKRRAITTKGITLWTTGVRQILRTGRGDILVHVVLLGLNKSKLCSCERATSSTNSCMDVSYLSTAEEDKFDTAIIEFLAEGDERSGKKRRKLRNTASWIPLWRVRLNQLVPVGGGTRTPWASACSMSRRADSLMW